MAIGAGWRVAVLWRARRRLRAALCHADAEQRAAAAEIAASQGLGRYVRPLLELTQTERSGEVLDRAAKAIMRQRWEPADSSSVVQLRLWAQSRRNEHPPHRNGHSGNGSRPTSRVLVTGAGGPAGVAVIRSLMQRGCAVVAVDADPTAVGFHLASSWEVIPEAADDRFASTLADIADRFGVRAVITTVAEEMIVLRNSGDVYDRIATWLPSLDALQICCDKWLFAQRMMKAGIPTPRTALGPSPEVPGPWIVKPRSSRGSRGVRSVDSVDALGSAVSDTENAIVQTRATGHEFTVDALVDRGGELVGAVPRWRLETRAGISMKGRTFDSDAVVEGVASVLSCVGLEGAANVQGFVDGDQVTFIEVNPRFSGGLPLSLAAGADLVGEYLRGVCGMAIRPERLAFRAGTTMVRHFEEIYP